MGETWRWDESLYAGSAPFYADGRVPYPQALVDVIVTELGLDGTARLLDVGCGPGSLTLLLAPHVASVLGVDADAAMLVEAESRAERARVMNASWLPVRGEDLTPDAGPFDVITLAQAFHWMDRPLVAATLHQLLDHKGALVFVHASTHEGTADASGLPHPRPPYEQINDLISAYLGPRRRAGAGTRPDAPDTDEIGVVESAIFREAGFAGPVRRTVPSWIATRTVDQIVASVFSLSFAAPHLFGDGVAAFEADLRGLLTASAPDGLFADRMREITVDFWPP